MNTEGGKGEGGREGGRGRERQRMNLRNGLDPSATSQGMHYYKLWKFTTLNILKSQTLFVGRGNKCQKQYWTSWCKGVAAHQPLLGVQQKTPLASRNSSIRAQV